MGARLNEFKKATREIKESMDIEGDLQDVKKSLDDLNTDVKDAVDLNPLKSAKPKPSPTDVAPDDRPSTEPAPDSPPSSTSEKAPRDE